MNIAIFGVSGFIGGHLASFFLSKGHEVYGFSRTSPNIKHESFIWTKIDTLINEKEFSWFKVNQIEVILDCSDPSTIRSRVDLKSYTNGKAKLLEAACEAGVRRFIYLSSLKALCESSSIPLNIDTRPNPESDYGHMKLAVETELLNKASKSNIQLFILRLPMVYGYGGGASLKKLSYLVEKKIPIPILGATNKRSLLSIKNLQHFLSLIISENLNGNKIMHLSDKNTVSTNQLVDLVAQCVNKKVFKIWVPRSLVKFIFFIFGKKFFYFSIYESLFIDQSSTIDALDWVPENINATCICDSVNAR